MPIVRQHNAPQQVRLFTTIYHLTVTVFLSGSDPIGCVLFSLSLGFFGLYGLVLAALETL